MTHADSKEAEVAAPNEDNKGVFASVNFATVIASALAAGTSLALATYIGIAGSLIGTVVAAAVSSISLQVYQVVLRRSADKIRDVADAALTQVQEPLAPESDTASTEATTRLDATACAALTDDTVVRARPINASNGGYEPATQTPRAPEELIRAAHAHEARDMRRRTLVVAIVAALAALALTAVAIFALTAGKGIGEKPSFSYTPAEEQVEDTQAAPADDTAEAGTEAISQSESTPTETQTGTTSDTSSSSDNSSTAEPSSTDSTNTSTEAATNSDTSGTNNESGQASDTSGQDEQATQATQTDAG